MHSSPQRCKAWLAKVTVSINKVENALSNIALMFILDIKTRRSSTHQMLHKFFSFSWFTSPDLVLGQAPDHCLIIDDFIAKTRDLCRFEMMPEDWEAISLVMSWLKFFRSAIMQMSTTKQPMLSLTHTIYRGLQYLLCTSLSTLPENTPSRLRLDLTQAQRLRIYFWCLSSYLFI